MRQVFLNYAREDAAHARRLYEALSAEPGIKVWFDQEDLLPGMNFKAEIFKAIRESRYFLALFSTHSVSAAGFRNSELQRGLEALKQFPEGDIYLIPVRVEECEPPFEEVRDLHYADLFDDWDGGYRSLRKSLRLPAQTASREQTAKAASKKADEPAAPAPSTGRIRPTEFHYRLGLVLLDGRTPELKAVAHGLNSIQKYFYLKIDSFGATPQALRRIEGSPHLDIDLLSSQFYDKIAPLQMDHVICATHRFLAFWSEGYRHWNYLGCTSPEDERVSFLSTRDREAYAADAGVSFETALAYGLVARLASNLLDIDPHPIRGCPLDFTDDQSLMVKGLEKGRFCRYCTRSLGQRNPSLREALHAMLGWGRR